MTSESGVGGRDRARPSDGEVGLRELLESHRTGPQTAVDPSSATTQPLRTQGRPSQPSNPRPNPSRPRRPAPLAAPQWWKSPQAKKAGIAAGAAVALGVLAYGADLLLTSGEVPRGVVVAGIEVGGMDPAEADARLHNALGGRAEEDLPLLIGDVQTSMVPARSGLAIDWDATWDRVGGQPINPFTRFFSLFGSRDVAVASRVDDGKLNEQMSALHVHDKPTVEGTVVFEGTTPVGVPPTPGRQLDGAAARQLIIDRWVLGSALDLPVVPAPLTVRPEAVDQALTELAEPAVSAAVTLTGKDASARLDPAQIASVLSFTPDGQGGLALTVNREAATALLAPQLAATEVEPKDATFAFAGGRASVVPAVIGEKVDWAKSLDLLPALLVAPQQRSAPAAYAKADPKLTTEAAEALRIVEPMGSFTTGGFSGPSGVNIRVVAEKVHGAVVKPGETFSLNDFTGPRGTAEGYVESGIIDHGRPSTAVGGGISQFATTLYNAAYFAGLEDAGHTEHSYYISRYPAAREATVFDGAIDLRFRNNTESGVYIEAVATGSDITVRLWGTKTVDVESVTGERTKPTEPQTITLPEGKDCIAATGAPGFTISDTRIIKDRASGREVSRHTRTVKYDPIPVVKCGEDKEEDKPEAPAERPQTAADGTQAPTSRPQETPSGR